VISMPIDPAQALPSFLRFKLVAGDQRPRRACLHAPLAVATARLQAFTNIGLRAPPDA
jgi:hypothetical protein